MPFWVLVLAMPDELREQPMTRDEFFAWCDERELTRNNGISSSFRVSSQTIRNWLRKEPEELMPAWVPLACDALDAISAGEVDAARAEPMTVSRLAEWQASHKFKTYDDTANVFSIKRQAVHNWYKRQRFPRWLALACIGYDIRTRRSASKDSATAA